MKVYDHVNWSFLLVVMEKIGFGKKWVVWMKWCISLASFSMLVNGSPLDFFQSSRGLRQGDLLFPYLFVLVMEALSQLLVKAREGDFIFGFLMSGRGSRLIEVTHLLNADNTIIFCEENEE